MSALPFIPFLVPLSFACGIWWRNRFHGDQVRRSYELGLRAGRKAGILEAIDRFEHINPSLISKMRREQ